MLQQQYVATAFAVITILVLEAWRRRLRHRVPLSIHVLAIILFVTIGVSAGYAGYRLQTLVTAIDHVDPANKATWLATGISAAMNGNAVAILATLSVIVVLGIGTWLARKAPEGGPIARVR